MVSRLQLDRQTELEQSYDKQQYTQKQAQRYCSCKRLEQQCKTCKEICKELEKFLNRKDPDRLYSDRWIREKEVPYDNDIIDETLTKKFLERRYGKQKDTKDDWE